jgi:hypothetical protein
MTTVVAEVDAKAGPVAHGGSKTMAWRDRLPVLVLFMPPALVLFTVFVILQMGEAAWYSLYNWNGYGLPTQFVGLRNFEVLFSRPAFLQSLINCGLIILVSLAIQLPLALWLATLVSNRIRGAVTFRLIFFMPYVLADVAAGLIWRFVYDGDYGLFGAIGRALGIEHLFLLADKDTAIYALLAVIVWKYVFRLPHDAVHCRDAGDRPRSARGRRDRWRLALAEVPLYHAAPAGLDAAAFGVLCHRRFAAALRHRHAAHRRRTVGHHADAGQFPLHLRCHAHAGRFRQCGRRGAVRPERRARLQLQADIHAK